MRARVVSNRVEIVKQNERVILQCKLKKRAAAGKQRYIDVKIKNRALRPGKMKQNIFFY